MVRRVAEGQRDAPGPGLLALGFLTLLSLAGDLLTRGLLAGEPLGLLAGRLLGLLARDVLALSLLKLRLLAGGLLAGGLLQLGPLSGRLLLLGFLTRLL